MPIFTVVFDDNTKFEGGDLQNTKWNEIPFKKIRSIFYQIPFGDILCLSGYEKYYHIVEIVTDLNGVNRGQNKIDNIYLLAKKQNNVFIYKMNLDKKLINKYEMNLEDEWIKNLNPQGWK